jgi:hypothetical protein
MGSSRETHEKLMGKTWENCGETMGWVMGRVLCRGEELRSNVAAITGLFEEGRVPVALQSEGNEKCKIINDKCKM